MLCPYCSTGFVKENETVRIATCPSVKSHHYGYSVRIIYCPQCKKLIVVLDDGGYNANKDGEFIREEYLWDVKNESIVYPKYSVHYQVPEVVPEKYAVDFKEADMLLDYSPKASAALSRRCLQNILHHEFSIKKRNLDQEIQEYYNAPRE